MQEAAALLTLAILTCVERARNRGSDAKLVGKLLLAENANRFKDALHGLLLRRLLSTASKHRAHYAPQDRSLIMSLAAEKNWTAKDIATALVIDESTARSWLHEWRSDPVSSLFTGKCAWNSYHEALKDLVHRIHSLFPESEIGARTIANHILKAAIAISRSTVQRYLRQPPQSTATPPASSGSDTPKNDSTASIHHPVPEPEATACVETFHMLKPEHINHVWHVDFTRIKVFWMTFWVVAILDGFSRKLLALKVSICAPTTLSVMNILKPIMAQFGAPRFMITDRGSQFRETFADLVRDLKLGIDVVRGPVKRPQFNGKIERFFRSLKLWQRPASGEWIAHLHFVQRCLDSFRDWYNGHRVHQGVHGLTPDEAWSGTHRPDPVRYFARDKLNPIFTVRRIHHHDDRHLPLFDIRVSAARKTA